MSIHKLVAKIAVACSYRKSIANHSAQGKLINRAYNVHCGWIDP